MAAEHLRTSTMKQSLRLAALLWLGSAFVTVTPAQNPGSSEITPLHEVERIDIGTIDKKAVQLEDELRQDMGEAPRYAIPYSVSLTPLLDGTWDDVDAKTMMWRLRVGAPGALSINLGFDRYFLPEGASLSIYSAHDLATCLRPFTAAHNEFHG